MIGVDIIENMKMAEVTSRSIVTSFSDQDLEFNQSKVNSNWLNLMTMNENKLENYKDIKML